MLIRPWKGFRISFLSCIRIQQSDREFRAPFREAALLFEQGRRVLADGFAVFPFILHGGEEFVRRDVFETADGRLADGVEEAVDFQTSTE